jgi:hypothetical protein
MGHSLQIGGAEIAPCPLFPESDAKSEPWHPSRGGTVAANHCDSPVMMVAQLYRTCGGARASGDSRIVAWCTSRSMAASVMTWLAEILPIAERLVGRDEQESAFMEGGDQLEQARTSHWSRPDPW